MKTFTGLAVATLLSLSAGAVAQAQTYASPIHPVQVGPGYERTFLYTGRSVYVEPPGRFRSRPSSRRTIRFAAFP